MIEKSDSTAARVFIQVQSLESPRLPGGILESKVRSYPLSVPGVPHKQTNKQKKNENKIKNFLRKPKKIKKSQENLRPSMVLSKGNREKKDREIFSSESKKRGYQAWAVAKGIRTDTIYRKKIGTETKPLVMVGEQRH